MSNSLITSNDYSCYYQALTLGIVTTGHEYYKAKKASEKDKEEGKNYQKGIIILSLVALVEANFIGSVDFKKLRKFEQINSIPNSINQTHISGFIYLRDCYAHNPLFKMLSNGTNTSKFIEAVNLQDFPFAEIKGDSILVKNDATHNLHLIILQLFESGVAN